MITFYNLISELNVTEMLFTLALRLIAGLIKELFCRVSVLIDRSIFINFVLAVCAGPSFFVPVGN